MINGDDILMDYEKQKVMEWVRKNNKNLQMCYCNKSARIRKNNLRASRKYYENSEEKLEQIKEKYKNGVTKDILKIFVSEII